MGLAESLKIIKSKIDNAAVKAGRKPKNVKIVAVTKTVPVEVIKEAVEAGVETLGENRVQEAKRKITVFKESGVKNIKWHMIGHLQINKVKTAIQLFDFIHSVDSIDLLKEINKQARKFEKRMDLLIQVKIAKDDTKTGLLPQDLLKALEFSKSLDFIKVLGLMTIPPFTIDPEQNRFYFRRLKELLQEAHDKGYPIKELSMGMTNDYEIAIEEGATMVRIGTALFGARQLQMQKEKEVHD
jgi:pyridoxal phosphate enzyme (YggS family)